MRGTPCRVCLGTQCLTRLLTPLQVQSGLDHRQLRSVVLSMTHAGANVDALKLVTEKGQLDEVGVKNRAFMDAIYQAVVEARNDSTKKVRGCLRGGVCFAGPWTGKCDGVCLEPGVTQCWCCPHPCWR